MTEVNNDDEMNALRELAANILRIASGKNAGEPYLLLQQAIDFVNAAILAAESGSNPPTCREIEDALQCKEDNPWRPDMSAEEIRRWEIHSEINDLQKNMLRVAAYRITGSVHVQLHLSEHNIYDGIRRICDLRNARAIR